MTDPGNHPSLVALRKDPDSFGTPGGLPPPGFACEKCYSRGVPRLPPSPTPADLRRVQSERWQMGPLYRYCRRCNEVRVHFPYPRP